MFQNIHLARIAVATALLLSIPLIAMQFTDEMAWGPSDFLIAGVLFFGAGLMYELAASKAGPLVYRVAAGIAVFAALLLVWMNLAVGLIGSEDNPANLLYLGVLLVGIIGAGVARLEPRGMAHALFATALAQALVPVIAMIIWRPPFGPGVVGVFILNGFFVMLFAVSALLFQSAARKHG